MGLIMLRIVSVCLYHSHIKTYNSHIKERLASWSSVVQNIQLAAVILLRCRIHRCFFIEAVYCLYNWYLLGVVLTLIKRAPSHYPGLRSSNPFKLYIHVEALEMSDTDSF